MQLMTRAVFGHFKVGNLRFVLVLEHPVDSTELVVIAVFLASCYDIHCMNHVFLSLPPCLFLTEKYLTAKDTGVKVYKIKLQNKWGDMHLWLLRFLSDLDIWVF